MREDLWGVVRADLEELEVVAVEEEDEVVGGCGNVLDFMDAFDIDALFF